MTFDNPVLDGILEQLMEEVSTPTLKTAEIWGNRHPQFRHEISEFVSEWLLQEAMAQGAVAVDEARALGRAKEHLSRALQDRIDNAFPGVAAAAERIGVKPLDLAARLEANEEFLERLDQRTVSPETIPSSFLFALAGALGVTVRAVARWMATGNPSVAFRIGQSGDSENMSFERVWRECGLSERALRRWTKKA